MFGLMDDAGRWRNSGVGIFQEQALIHIAPPALQIPRLMADLFNWLATTDYHPLISSCVFHYEFEFIHPFSDGNGRLGRLWQTLILSQWRTEMAFLPVESIIKEQQSVLGIAGSAK
jgi:Fic family protein